MPCRSTFVGPSGFCPAHDPERPADMRELGHRGGKARRKGIGEQLPEAERASLREQLRRALDPELVVRTANEILAGENQTARGNMIRFLADLELYRKDGGEQDDERLRQVRAARERQRLANLLSGRAAAAAAEGQRELCVVLVPSESSRL